MQSMAEPLKHNPTAESIYEHKEQQGMSIPSTSSANNIDELTTVRLEIEEQLSKISIDESPEILNDSDDNTLTNQSDLEKSEAAADNKTLIAPPTPRSLREPFHISNIIKRTAPPPSLECNNGVTESRTSIETQYTSSQASIPSGPPNATSTPYASDMGLGFPPLREQTTTRGVFDKNGGTLSDDVWNVSIDIPKGAIPPDVKQEIYFTVTDPRLSSTVGGPPLDMENGSLIIITYIKFPLVSFNCCCCNIFLI